MEAYFTWLTAIILFCRQSVSLSYPTQWGYHAANVWRLEQRAVICVRDQSPDQPERACLDGIGRVPRLRFIGSRVEVSFRQKGVLGS